MSKGKEKCTTKDLLKGSFASIRIFCIHFFFHDFSFTRYLRLLRVSCWWFWAWGFIWPGCFVESFDNLPFQPLLDDFDLSSCSFSAPFLNQFWTLRFKIKTLGTTFSKNFSSFDCFSGFKSLMLYRANFSLAMIKFLLLQNKPSVVAVYLSNLAPRLNDNTGLQILGAKNCFTCDTFF